MAIYETGKAIYPEIVEEFFEDEPDLGAQGDQQLDMEYTRLLTAHE